LFHYSSCEGRELSSSSSGTRLFLRLRSKKVAPAEQLSMPKLELQMPNPYKPEMTNSKHQMTNKFQMTISKSQIRSKANCLEFWISLIVICLIFVFCYLKFSIT